MYNKTKTNTEPHQPMGSTPNNESTTTEPPNRSGGSVVVDSLYLVAPIVCGCSVFGTCFVI